MLVDSYEAWKEDWELDERNPKNVLWPTFSDEKHPLRPDEIQGMASPKVVSRKISRRLEASFNEAKNVNGLTRQRWADYCGAKDRQTPTRWIQKPETMDAGSVKKTCELFNVTLDYLRGITGHPNETAEIWDSELIAGLYEVFSSSHRKMITDIVKEFVISEMATGRFDKLLQEADSELYEALMEAENT